MLVLYVQGADKRAMANTETEEVYVVEKTIEAGTTAANLGDAVAKKSVPKAAVAADSVTNLSDLGQKVSSVQLVPGELLLASRMVDPTKLVGTGRVEVPVGLQELTVRLSIDRIAGGNLQAGDTVGVILSFAENEKQQLPDQTQLLFEKVLVTAVQYSTGSIAADKEAASGESEGGALNANSSTSGGEGYMVTLARTQSMPRKSFTLSNLARST